jgi:hypothetical protein
MGDDRRMAVALDSLIVNWWRFQHLSSGTRDERIALEAGQPVDVIEANAYVKDQVALGGPAAIDLIVRLVEAAPASDAVTTVGAGPLEDLVQEHGDELIAELETSARRSPVFAEALGAVWLEAGDVTSDTAERLAPWLR